MDDLGRFLENNSFYKLGHNVYDSAHCCVTIWDDYIEILDYKENGTMHSNDLNIYWLIGVLTYNGWMRKEYNQNG